jgi:hypothetical protein
MHLRIETTLHMNRFRPESIVHNRVELLVLWCVIRQFSYAEVYFIPDAKIHLQGDCRRSRSRLV